MSIYVGLDVGGTKFMAASADTEGTLLRRVQHPTPRDLAAGLELLDRMAREVAGEDAILGIGASVGGPLDYRTGVVSPLHQPAWRDVPLKAIFERAFGCPFSVDVDTNAAAFAEYRWGGDGGDAPTRLLYVTLSTGMGGGFVVDGALYRGAAGAHPEVGHQAIPVQRASEYPPPLCECGAEGCLEALVSGNGIRRRYGKPAEQLDADEWREVAAHLGVGLRNMAALYAPDVIALGGGVAVGGGEALLAEARRVMADGLRLVPAPQIRLSALGYDTALYGAIALAMEASKSGTARSSAPVP